MDTKKLETVVIEPSVCHEGCANISVNGHYAEVNKSDYGSRWMLDCNTCGTCIHVFDYRDDAIAAAKVHIRLNSDLYWELRQVGLTV